MDEGRGAGGREVQRKDGWELGGPWWGGIAGFHTWNIGPLGWQKSTDDLLRLLQSRPTVLTLQDVRLGPKGIKGVRAWLRANAPNYHAFLNTARHTREVAEGEWRRTWVGIITLIHKEARPSLHTKRLQDEGISVEDAKWAEGRIMVNSLPGRQKADKNTLVINIYQHQAKDGADQERLIGILSRYMRRMKGKCATIFVAGDFNAALPGGRRGYVGDFEEPDARLARFHAEQRFLPGSGSTGITWTPFCILLSLCLPMVTEQPLLWEFFCVTATTVRIT